MAHINRKVTIMGKADILNYIGYSKFWHKAMALLLPTNACKRDNGMFVNIREEIDLYTNGFLWGFCAQDNSENINYNENRRTKQALFSKNTLFLDKNDGGINLIDYDNKLKALRIMLIFKYFDNKDKPWKSITRYWFCSTLRHISNEEWNNQYPHVADIEEVPQFFKQCILDFKEYYRNFGTSINEKCNTKTIYCNLIKQKNHIPASVIRFPEYLTNGFFENLHKSYFLDPYLREFLFKLYHTKLMFKRYKLNINDLLNFERHRCTLCNISIETPKHLFSICRLGLMMRNKRNSILQKMNLNQQNTYEENFIYSNFKNDGIDNNIRKFIVTAANYTIYKAKMKKFYNVDTNVSNIDIAKIFIETVKNRITIDHKRMSQLNFKETWDPGGSQSLMEYTVNEIKRWKI